MDAFQILGSTLGLSYLAGLRLYLTVLTLGLGVRFGLIHLPETLSGLSVLTHPVVLIVAGAACAAEFISDKIPWFDTVWDTAHTFIRPVGAALLGATALSGSLDGKTRVAIALLCGGVAFTSHASKAGTRVMVNHSPEPFSNIALSLAGDLAAPIGVWFVTSHPIIAFVLVTIALVVSVVLIRFIWRGFRTVLAKLGLTRQESTPPPYTARSVSR